MVIFLIIIISISSHACVCLYVCPLQPPYRQLQFDDVISAGEMPNEEQKKQQPTKKKMLQTHKWWVSGGAMRIGLRQPNVHIQSHFRWVLFVLVGQKMHLFSSVFLFPNKCYIYIIKQTVVLVPLKIDAA